MGNEPTGDEVREFAEQQTGGKIPDALWSSMHYVTWKKALIESREKDTSEKGDSHE